MLRSLTLALLLLPQEPKDKNSHGVLVELFTSQGCSSCPPADTLLITLESLGINPAPVTRLAFHVDYWDNLGWKDPFAKEIFTERQKAYSAAHAENSLWTPQFRVNGTSVRGHEELKKAIQAALSEKAQFAIRILSAVTKDRKVIVEASVEKLDPKLLVSESLVLRMAVFENELETKAAKGENQGRTLAEGFVVRQWSDSQKFSGESGKVLKVMKELPLDADWNPKRLGVALVLEDSRAMKVLEVASTSLR